MKKRANLCALPDEPISAVSWSHPEVREVHGAPAVREEAFQEAEDLQAEAAPPGAGRGNRNMFFNIKRRRQ
jgi:hypothetical protein